MQSIKQLLLNNLLFYTKIFTTWSYFKDWKSIQPYSGYSLNWFLNLHPVLYHRKQAFATNIVYNRDAKIDNLKFDVGGKQVIQLSNLNTINVLKNNNYGKLNIKKNYLYQLFPSFNQKVLVESINPTVNSLNNLTSIRISGNNWLNNNTAWLFKRKLNYVNKTKMINNEIDQIISGFNANWPEVYVQNWASYWLLSHSKYFSMFIDNGYTFKSNTGNFFRYYNNICIRKHLWSQKMQIFWKNLTRSISIDINKLRLQVNCDLLNQINFIFNMKLNIALVYLDISVSIISLLFYVTYNFFINSLVLLQLFSWSIISINWKYNKLIKQIKYTPSKLYCLNKKTILNRFIYWFGFSQILQFPNHFFTKINANYFASSRISKTKNIESVINKYKQNLITQTDSEPIRVDIITKPNKFYTKNLAPIQQLIDNLIDKPIFDHIYLDRFNNLNFKKIVLSVFKTPIDYKVRQFEYKVKLLDIKSNVLNTFQYSVLLVKFPEIFNNIIQFIYKWYNANDLLKGYLLKYQERTDLYGVTKPTTINWAIVIISIFFYFDKSKRKGNYKLWHKLFKYSNIIYQNYGVFKGYIATISKYSRFFELIYALPILQYYNTNNLQQDELKYYTRFENLDTYILKLQSLKITPQHLQIINFDYRSKNKKKNNYKKNINKNNYMYFNTSKKKIYNNIHPLKKKPRQSFVNNIYELQPEVASYILQPTYNFFKDFNAVIGRTVNLDDYKLTRFNCTYKYGKLQRIIVEKNGYITEIHKIKKDKLNEIKIFLVLGEYMVIQKLSEFNKEKLIFKRQQIELFEKGKLKQIDLVKKNEIISHFIIESDGELTGWKKRIFNKTSQVHLIEKGKLKQIDLIPNNITNNITNNIKKRDIVREFNFYLMLRTNFAVRWAVYNVPTSNYKGKKFNRFYQKKKLNKSLKYKSISTQFKEMLAKVVYQQFSFRKLTLNRNMKLHMKRIIFKLNLNYLANYYSPVVSNMFLIHNKEKFIHSLKKKWLTKTPVWNPVLTSWDSKFYYNKRVKPVRTYMDHSATIWNSDLLPYNNKLNPALQTLQNKGWKFKAHDIFLNFMVNFIVSSLLIYAKNLLRKLINKPRKKKFIAEQRKPKKQETPKERLERNLLGQPELKKLEILLNAFILRQFSLNNMIIYAGMKTNQIKEQIELLINKISQQQSTSESVEEIEKLLELHLNNKMDLTVEPNAETNDIVNWIYNALWVMKQKADNVDKSDLSYKETIGYYLFKGAESRAESKKNKKQAKENKKNKD